MLINKKEVDKKLEGISVGETIETNFALVGNLTEAFFDDNERTADVTVIRKGWSKNGFYYGDKPLESIANFINIEAKHVFLNHNKRSEIFEPRKAEDHIANNISAVVSEDKTKVIAKAKYFKSGPNAWIYDRMKESPEGIGPSIVGKAKIRKGTVEGRTGAIVEDIVYLHSYDIVVKPAAGGSVDKVSESFSVPDGEDFIHVYEGIVSDEENVFLTEAVSDNVPKLKEKIQQKTSRREAERKWYDLQSVFIYQLEDIVLARNDYQYMSTKERRKLVDPLLVEFKAEVNKIKFVEPAPLPMKAQKEIDESLEFSEAEGFIKIRLHPKGAFEKSSFRKIIISKENGITASVGKLKNSPRKSEVSSYSFDVTKGWTEELAKKWLEDNVKSITKEGEEMDIKNLSDLKTQLPDIYNSLISEAQNDVKVKESINKWKEDSEKLETVAEEIANLKEKIVALEKEKEEADSKIKVLEEANSEYAAKELEIKKATIILETKKEVGLSEDACSDVFNQLLESIEFDPEKEDEFKAKVKESIEDRKSVFDKTSKKKVVEGAGPTKAKTDSSVTETKIPDNKEVAKMIKSSF